MFGKLPLKGRPVVSQDFAWTVTANWSRNINKVKALAPEIDNYQLASPQGDVTISAALGQPMVLFAVPTTFILKMVNQL